MQTQTRSQDICDQVMSETFEYGVYAPSVADKEAVLEELQRLDIPVIRTHPLAVVVGLNFLIANDAIKKVTHRGVRVTLQRFFEERTRGIIPRSNPILECLP